MNKTQILRKCHKDKIKRKESRLQVILLKIAIFESLDASLIPYGH